MIKCVSLLHVMIMHILTDPVRELQTVDEKQQDCCDDGWRTRDPAPGRAVWLFFFAGIRLLGRGYSLRGEDYSSWLIEPGFI